MASPKLDNQAIVDRMLAARRAGGTGAGAPQGASDCVGFDLESFGVTYPNNELVATVQIATVPSGVTLLGATMVVAPAPSSGVTYCMAVAANDAGLPLPLSLLAASTSPSFTGPTAVVGVVILSFVRKGSSDAEQCTVTRKFTVGG